jgi:hypothetical protein
VSYVSDEQRGWRPKAPGPYLGSFAAGGGETIVEGEARPWAASASLLPQIAQAIFGRRSSNPHQARASKTFMITRSEH